jgi:hypothetical protein
MLEIKQSTQGMQFENEEPALRVDAPSIKKGDYIEEKWICEEKEFIKLHTSVDEKLKNVVF